MENRIVGRFYFKRTSNGNLIGEFSNHHKDSRIFTESCDSQGGNSSFLGRYYSTWQEGGVAIFADLEISPTPRNSNLFSLTWRDKSGGNIIFKGEGMLCDDILVGDYQSNK